MLLNFFRMLSTERPKPRQYETYEEYVKAENDWQSFYRKLSFALGLIGLISVGYILVFVYWMISYWMIS